MRRLRVYSDSSDQQTFKVPRGTVVPATLALLPGIAYSDGSKPPSSRQIRQDDHVPLSLGKAMRDSTAFSGSTPKDYLSFRDIVRHATMPVA
jgi:hypothetical protein